MQPVPGTASVGARAMKFRLLLVILAAAAVLLPAPALLLLAQLEAPPAKPVRVHALELTGQWGADISPDGRTVAVALLHKGIWGDYRREDLFVEAELWDFRAKRRLAHRTISHRPNIAVTTAEWGQVRYTTDGRVLLIYDGELLNVLKAETLEEITRIDLGLPAMPREAEVVDLAAPHDAHGQMAVLVSRGAGRGGAVRLYSLETGALRRTWEFEHGYPESGGHLAWRPDGKRLAVTLPPVPPGQRLPKDEKTLEVLDPDSGKILLRLNTGYLAGPVAYTADGKVLTSTAEMPWTLPSGTHAIKVWDASTGRLLREIQSPPTGVRGSMELSADGRRLVGYIGMENSANPTQDPETIFGIREQRFRLWELPGGRTVVTSRPIEPNVAKRAQLRLSARGNFVLVFWKYSDKPVLVYEVP